MAQIFGKIHKINEIQQVSANFQKREIVIETDEQFKQMILVELHHDNVYLIDEFEVGRNVAVSINLKGRAWVSPVTNETKYFNTIVGWKIEIPNYEKNKPTPPVPDPQYAPPTPSTAFPPNQEEEDDLPF
jgi:hypothetical protein